MDNVSVAEYFDDKIKEPESNVKLLPLFHSCDGLAFKSILLKRSFLPKECSVFVGEKLLYLFYGRPAYKKRELETNPTNSYLPISFILDWNHIPDVKRIAPFDTGAFSYKIYEDYIRPEIKVNQFFMRPEKSSVTKTTNFFFGRNGAYYDGKAKDKIVYDPLDFEIEAYHNLITSKGTQRADDRKTTIEVQFNNPIELTKESLKAVILPSHFKTSDIVKQVLRDELKTQIISYDSFGVPSADNYTHTLALAKAFLMRNKYFLSK